MSCPREKKSSDSQLTTAGLEPATLRLEAECAIHLRHVALLHIYKKKFPCVQPRM